MIRHDPIDDRDTEPTHRLERAQPAQVRLDVRRQVAREGHEQDPPGSFLRGVGQVLGEPLGAMHRDHGLAGAGAAQHPNRPVPVPFDQTPLGGMQEHAPLLERRLQHRLEGAVVVDHPEAPPAVRTGERLVELGIDVAGTGLDRVRGQSRALLLLVQHFLEAVAGSDHEEGFGRLLGQARGERLQVLVAGNPAHRRQQALRHAEPLEMAVAISSNSAGAFGTGTVGVSAAVSSTVWTSTI